MMRLYSALLHLFPASFRAEYGSEMRVVVGERFRETSGTLARVALWIETVTDVVTDAAAVHWDILRQDLRFTARTLARSPGFALTAVLVTALGIGANTAAFSVADFVLLRPLPYPDGDRLVKLWQLRPGERGSGNQVSPPVYREWERSTRTIEAMGAFYNGAVNLVGDGEPQRLESSAVTASLLPILGMPPMVGRFFHPSEELEGDAGPVIISHGVWQTQFGADPHVVGRKLIIDGNPRVVIGVMPAEFHFPRREVGLWRLMRTEETRDDDVTNTYWDVVAKLRPDASVEQTTAELRLIGRAVQQRYPDAIEGVGAYVNRLRDDVAPQSKQLLLALCAAAACVLLIACANLANLLLARALRRRKEILVRTALGAGRERIVRQSMTESLVLAALGGVLGVGVAYIALPLLTRLVPADLPVADAPTIDLRVLGFAGLLTAVTGIGFGVLPAWKSAGKLDLTGLGEGARSGGRRERARSALVIAEVMTSVVLLISAGLLMRAVVRIQGVDPGFRADSVLTLRTALPEPRYPTVARRATFYRGVLAEVRAIPGVSSAAYVTSLPIAQQGGVWPVFPERESITRAQARNATSRFVTPGYFTSMGIPIRQGRDVSETDHTDQPWVAVVSESFASRYWPGVDPLGKRFRFDTDVRTVVGVVGDVRMRGLERTSEPQVYLAYEQIPEGPDSNGVVNTTARFYAPKDLVIRSSLPAATLIPAVRRIVQRVDPQQPISNVQPMGAIVAEVTAARSVQVRVLLAFAAVAFLLAAVGIHGLLSFTVSSRQHEIGIRMALGAQRGQIIRLIMSRGIVLTAAGVIPGLAIAYLAGRWMRSLLAGVPPADVVTFATAGVLCAIMALVGSLLPTLRAARVDPATALRAEV